jgi:hypothetical protein
MPSFDYTFTCINAKQKDYESDKYKNDLDIVYKFLDAFDVKREFKKIMEDIMQHETYFGVLRDESDDKIIFQQLPYSYCKVTGRSEISPLLFDFNMIYFFNQVGISLQMFPTIFTEMYNRVVDSKNNGYNPANSLDKRTGEWVYWTQCSPLDGFFSFKFSFNNATSIPYLAPLYSDVVLHPMFRTLQKNINILRSQKVMVGLIPFLQNKGASVKDSLAIDPVTLGNFLGLLKAGISDAIKIGGAPFSDVKTFDFDSTNPNLLEDYLKTTAAMSGVNSRLIFANDKMANFESQASLDTDRILATAIYWQFEQFLDYQINKRVKDFKFKFKFEGSDYQTNRQFRLDNALKLAAVGITLPQKIAAALGMDVADFYRQLEDCKAMGFSKMLTLLASTYTQSGAGRPEKSVNELNDGGASAKDYE